MRHDPLQLRPIGPTASIVIVMLLAGCAGRSWHRPREARPTATIFSPLDLPAPNRLRTASGAPGPDYWQQRADYVIEASLDVESNLVRGRETITYTNNSPDPLPYLWLHLEQNIFPEGSIASKIAQGTQIGMTRTFGQGYTIESVRAGGEDLVLHVYDTVGRVDLARPLAPGGGTLRLEIAWRFTIPDKVFRRFGIEKVEQGTIYEIAQWFPAMAVYDDVHGWNTLPYLGTGEFYTNFGDFDVTLTVPRSHIVAATGVLQNPADVYTGEQLERLEQARHSAETVTIRGRKEVDDPASRPAGEGPLAWHFRAENVRTFALASSDAFIYDACDLDGILVQSVYPKEKIEPWWDSTQMLRTAIDGYNTRWFRYPYPEATNVYGEEGGMEYPMLIFCRGGDDRGLYGVTTHEIGHNWFPMVVNTDERRHAWMDEGFNTFINYYSFGEWFEGEKGRRGAALTFARKMLEPDVPPMESFPDRLPRGLLGELEYEKTAVGLVLLREQILGPERFDDAFRTYIRRWAFKSPQPADFFRTMEDVSGMDLAWFWRGWILESGYLDQMVRGVGQGVRRPQREEDPRRRDRGDEEAPEPPRRTVVVTIDNLGALVMPVVMRVTYADGTEETRRYPVEIWFNRNRYRASWPSERRVVKVLIDPEEKFPDVNRQNNAWAWPRP